MVWLIGCIFIPAFGPPHAFQMLWVPLAELRSGSLQFTCSWAAYCGDGRAHWLITLEPPRSAVVTELPGVGFQIRDWNCSRWVVISADGQAVIIVYVLVAFT